MEIIKNEENYNIADWWIKVVIENYANFEGRARHSEYWYFVLAQALLNLSALIVGAFVIEGLGIEGLITIFAGFYIIALVGLLIPTLVVSVRRLHDSGKSGWFYFISLIPFGSIILLVFLYRTVSPATINGDQIQKK